MNLKRKLANPSLIRDPLSAKSLSRAKLLRAAKQTCIKLPCKLLSARLSSRSSYFIMLLCVPALALLFGMMIPPIIFPSAENEAYFYFAHSFSRDLSSGYMLALAVICMFFAPALPASEEGSHEAI